jgi:hypothetical protein
MKTTDVGLCAACAQRAHATTVRAAPTDPDAVARALGLLAAGDDTYRCASCNLAHRTTHDGEGFIVTKATMQCPRCRSIDVDLDLDKSVFEQKHLQCRACRHSGYADNYDDEWDARGFGCPRCFGTDASAAWGAMRASREATVVQESHFSVHVTSCTCGQHYVEVFMERIDWRGGDDDQTWCMFPIRQDEYLRLAASAEPDVERVVAELAGERRFLVRARDEQDVMAAWWREGGFMIGPHD